VIRVFVWRLASLKISEQPAELALRVYLDPALLKVEEIPLCVIKACEIGSRIT